MRTPFLTALPSEALKGLEVHEVVRDYPELLVPLRKSGIGLQESGPLGLGEVLFDRGGEAEALASSLRWRENPGP